MSSNSLCFTGFSRDDLAQAQALFEQANAQRGQRWSQAAEADAGVLVIDMDSMYGHMTWLKATGSGRRTVGVTAGERCETDFLLRRPFGVEGMAALLAELELYLFAQLDSIRQAFPHLRRARVARKQPFTVHQSLPPF